MGFVFYYKYCAPYSQGFAKVINISERKFYSVAQGLRMFYFCTP